MAHRLQQLISGFRYKLAFSNWVALLWSRVAGRNNPVLHYIWKNHWHLYCDPRSGDHGSVEEVLSDGVYNESILQSSRGGSCSYVNVGANVGAFDIAVASQKTIPYALTAELNPFTFTRLAFNMCANGLNMIRLCNGGIAGDSGTLRFVARSNSVNDNIFAEEPPPGDDSTKVSLFTLEEALANAGMTGKTFDLLKLDAECAEFDIVEKSSRELLRKFAHIVMELHEPPEGRSPEKLYAKLAECGFNSDQPQWKAGGGLGLRFWKRID